MAGIIQKPHAQNRNAKRLGILLSILPLALSGMSTEFVGALTTFILLGGLGLGLFALMEMTWLGQLRHAHRQPLPAPS